MEVNGGQRGAAIPRAMDSRRGDPLYVE